MSRAGSAWSSRPRIWRCSPRWCRACGTARSRPTRCSWARSGWAARYGPWPAWSGGWRRPRARASAASSARRGRGSRPARRGWSSSRWTGSVGSPAASRPGVGGVVLAGVGGVRCPARPFVRRETIDSVIARARGGGGAVAAVPVSDTVKEVVENRQIVRTVPRERLWRTHTPQGFPRAMLEQAYARLGGNEAPTDDAEVCERAGAPLEVVPDTPQNFKVTTADDFRIAEALARELR